MGSLKLRTAGEAIVKNALGIIGAIALLALLFLALAWWTTNGGEAEISDKPGWF